MPCPVVRHEPTIPCPPPTDPTGFIYPSYRAAQTETQRDAPSLYSSHQPSAYVSSAVGGSVSTLSFEDTTKNYGSSPSRRGGGIRDRVKGFSRASRRNLLLRLASINRRAFRAFKGKMIFVTLTYPKQYPEDPELCKRHLKALRKRLQREYEGVRLIRWFLEAGYTEQRCVALPLTTVHGTVIWTDRRATPLHIRFLA
jgi:hypothetical protein